MSHATFTDDLEGDPSVFEDPDTIKQVLFQPIGRDNLRPYLLVCHTCRGFLVEKARVILDAKLRQVLHNSGRLNTYEAQPRFTLDSTNLSRRSLAIRYRKVHTQLLTSSPTSKLPYKLHPFDDLEGYTGCFVTGEKPQWIIGSDKHPLRSFGLKQAAKTFGVTRHLGGMGDYFIRIEDVSLRLLIRDLMDLS